MISYKYINFVKKNYHLTSFLFFLYFSIQIINIFFLISFSYFFTQSNKKNHFFFSFFFPLLSYLMKQQPKKKFLLVLFLTNETEDSTNSGFSVYAISLHAMANSPVGPC